MILTVFLCLSLYFFGWIVDDLYIYFRYVNNFVRGDGIVYNINEYVEGFSSFIWFLILSLFGFMKLPLEESSKIASLIFAVLSLFIVYKISKELCFGVWSLFSVSLTVINLPYILWSVSGFEISFYLLLLLLVSYKIIIIKKNKIQTKTLIILLALISFTRPEGFLFSFTFLLSIYFYTKGVKKEFITIMLGYFILFISFLMFRYLYFGDFLPNTYYAKLDNGIIGYNEIKIYKSGLAYIGKFFLSNIHFAILLFMFVYQIKLLIKKANVKLLLSLIFIQLIFVCYSGGDWMNQSRFLVCIIPFISILSTIILKNSINQKVSTKSHYIIIYFLGIIFLFTNLFLKDFNSIKGEGIFWNNVKVVSIDLKNIIPANSVVANGSAGIIPYYLDDIRFIDVIGLTDRYIAKNGKRDGIWFEKYSTDYVFSKNPDWIILWKIKNKYGEFTTENSNPSFKHIESDLKFSEYHLYKSYNVFEDKRIDLFKRQ